MTFWQLALPGSRQIARNRSIFGADGLAFGLQTYWTVSAIVWPRIRAVPLTTLVAAACIASAADEQSPAGALAFAETGAATSSAGAIDGIHDIIEAHGLELQSENEGETEGSLPRTRLPLRVLATLRDSSSEPEQARATILDAETNTIATFRTGDEIRPGVALAAVTSEGIELEIGDVRERLEVGTEAAPLRPDYELYPDLAESTLPHAMDQAVRLRSGPGFRVRTPRHAWGTPRTIHLIERALTRYRQHGLGGPEVLIGDLSRREGGYFPPHLSHHDGRDVDIGYVHHQPHGRTFSRATPRKLDLRRTWALIESFLHSGQVRYIFLDHAIQRRLFEFAAEQGYPQHQLETWFQWPHGPSSAHGIVRHWRGHDDHFHVRFRRE